MSGLEIIDTEEGCDLMAGATQGDVRAAVAVLQSEMKTLQEQYKVVADDVKTLLNARQLEIGRSMAVKGMKVTALTALGAGGIKLVEWVGHMLNHPPPQ